MKNSLVIFALLLSIDNAIAQIQTNLVLTAMPPSTLTQWSYNRETLIFTVSRPLGVASQYKIKTEIKTSDGLVIAKTDLTKSPIYTFGGATITTYSAAEVLPLEYMIYSGSVKSTIEKTGKLPGNTYQLCVQLVSPGELLPLSEERCRTFTVAALQLPILLKPAPEELLNYDLAKNTILFRWSPLVPAGRTSPTYIIRVFEVLPHQNPVQAMRSNFPVLTKEVRGTTQYIWQPQGIIGDLKMIPGDTNAVKQNTTNDKDLNKEKNKTTTIPIASAESANTPTESAIRTKTSIKTYVWTIQTLDNNGTPVGDGHINGDGVSEPQVFKLSIETLMPKEKNR